MRITSAGSSLLAHLVELAFRANLVNRLRPMAFQDDGPLPTREEAARALKLLSEALERFNAGEDPTSWNEKLLRVLGDAHAMQADLEEAFGVDPKEQELGRVDGSVLTYWDGILFVVSEQIAELLDELDLSTEEDRTIFKTCLGYYAVILDVVDHPDEGGRRPLQSSEPHQEEGRAAQSVASSTRLPTMPAVESAMSALDHKYGDQERLDVEEGAWVRNLEGTAEASKRVVEELFLAAGAADRKRSAKTFGKVKKLLYDPETRRSVEEAGLVDASGNAPTALREAAEWIADAPGIGKKAARLLRKIADATDGRATREELWAAAVANQRRRAALREKPSRWDGSQRHGEPERLPEL